MAICKSLLVGWRAPRWGSRASEVPLLRNRFAPLRPFVLAVAVCWLMCIGNGVVGAVCGVVARAHEEKNRSGSGRALPPRLFRPRPKSFGRSAIEAFASNRPKENTPGKPVAAARLFAKRPNAFVGVFCLPWVFASLTSCFFSPVPPVAALLPPLRSLRSLPGGCVCALAGGCVYAPPSSLAPFGSGGSLLAPLRPAQGLARPWANVVLPPALLSARGGDGAGLCVSLVFVICLHSSRYLLLWLGPRNAEKAGVPSCPARLRPASALRPQVWGFLMFSGGWRGRHVPYSSHLSCAATPTTRFSLLRARARNGRFGSPKLLVGGCRLRTRACDLMLP